MAASWLRIGARSDRSRWQPRKVYRTERSRNRKQMKRLESYFTAYLLLAVAPAFGQTLKVEAMANPSGATSLQAHWGTAHDGSPLLSWVETTKDGSYTLRYAIHRGTQWTEPRTIATNRRFFRQPAE